MNYIEDLVDEINRLSNIYERYIDRHDGVKLNLYIDDRKISFKLYDDNEILDEFILEFNKYEKKVYKYVSIRTIILLLGNMMIYNEDNKFYNNSHKPYLRVIVKDSEIYEIMMQLLERQEDEVINTKNETVENLHVKTPRIFYPFRFMANLDMRVEFTDMLLKRVKV